MAALSEQTMRRWMERKDLTIEELVESADSLLAEIAPEQTRYKVREKPDVRTIRYYVSQNLLPKPISYEGGRARYGGAHLLRLLAIKRMQAEHETLGRIHKELDGASDDELIRKLMSEGRPRTPPPEVKALRAVKSAPSPTPQHAPKRLVLHPGGALEVPLHVLEDPNQRRQLAENLESLAAWLRAMSGAGAPEE